ncbi:FecR family protein [Thalassospira lucentensis]|uniref:FecR family protein n=1 Tax=Thalassospira lucentensis TaxID=168935 RepID=UPI003AA84B49
MQDHNGPNEQQKDQAALWHAKRAGGSMSAADEIAFDAWLNSDRGNRLAFDQMRVLWAQVEAPARRASKAQAKVGLLKFLAIFTPKRTVAALACAATIALGVFVINPDIVVNARADIVSDNATVTDVKLPDGSVVRLAANSALATDFASGHRVVKLLRGQAFFDVTHRHGDSFDVHTKDANIRVVGTRFNVDYLSGSTIVAVQEGAVRVSSPAQMNDGVLLGPGQQVAIGNGFKKLEATDIGDVTPVLSWMQGRLSVRNVRVDDLITRLNNFSESRVMVLGDVANRTISGSFPTTDVSGSVETVAAAVDGTVVHTLPWLTVIY